MIKNVKNITRQDKEPYFVPKRVQDVIPISCVWPDGIFKVGAKFSKTYRFTDINYMVASREDKEGMFLMYSELLNSLDSSATTKLTISNHRQNRGSFEESILMAMRGDGLDEYRKVTVPPVTAEAEDVRHSAYIVGYPDGSFGPANNMTRSEAAAIFARILASAKGDNITPSATTKFTDIPANSWYSGYVNYLSGYGIVTGREDNTFAPNAPVTRAEFTAMAVRFFAVYGDGDAEIMEQYKEFNDVAPGYWAAQ